MFGSTGTSGLDFVWFEGFGWSFEVPSGKDIDGLVACAILAVAAERGNGSEYGERMADSGLELCSECVDAGRT